LVYLFYLPLNVPLLGYNYQKHQITLTGERLKMNYRRLGRTDFKVGEMGLGTEYLHSASRKIIKSVLDLALDNAINYLDMFFVEPNFRDNIGSALGKKRAKMIVGGHI